MSIKSVRSSAPFAFYHTLSHQQITPPLVSLFFLKNRWTEETVNDKNKLKFISSIWLKGCIIILLNSVLDIYICSVSAAHNVSAKDKWLAFVSTTGEILFWTEWINKILLAETNNPQAELEGAFKFLGPIDKKFIYVQDVFQPKADNPADNVSRNRFFLTWVFFSRFSSRNLMMLRRTLRQHVRISWKSTSRLLAKTSTFPPARYVELYCFYRGRLEIPKFGETKTKKKSSAQLKIRLMLKKDVKAVSSWRTRTIFACISVYLYTFRARVQ